MPKRDSDATTYTAKRVCKAAGIELGTLRAWRRARGDLPAVVVVENEKDEAMSWTRYTLGDALRICVLAGLVHAGVDLRVAAELVEALQTESRRFKVPVKAVEGDLPYYLIVSTMTEKMPRTKLGWSVPDVLLSNDPEDAVAMVIDIAKICRGALQALREAR